MALADTLFLRQMQAKARDAQRREQRLASHDEQMRRFYETSGRVMRDAAAANASQAQVDQAKAERTAALESTAGTKRTEYEDPRADRIAREAYQAIQLKKSAAQAAAQAKEETYGRHKMFEGRLGEASKILGREATASEGRLNRASRERIAGMRKTGGAGGASDAAKGIVKFLEKRSTDIFQDFPHLYTASEIQLKTLLTQLPEEQALAVWSTTPQFQAMADKIGPGAAEEMRTILGGAALMQAQQQQRDFEYNTQEDLARESQLPGGGEGPVQFGGGPRGTASPPPTSARGGNDAKRRVKSKLRAAINAELSGVAASDIGD